MTGISRRGYAKPQFVQKMKSFSSERTVPPAPRVLDLATRCSRKVQDNIFTDSFFPSSLTDGHLSPWSPVTTPDR